MHVIVLVVFYMYTENMEKGKTGRKFKSLLHGITFDQIFDKVNIFSIMFLFTS